MEIKDVQLKVMKTSSKLLPMAEDIDRPKDASYRETRDSLKNYGLIHPIVLCYVKEVKQWVLVCGRARLLAAYELGWSTIRVLKGKLNTMEEVSVYRLQENIKRSNNIISDFLSVREVLTETLNYEVTAKRLGIQAQTVKKLNKDYGSIPLNFLVAAVDGNIATGTVKEIGKLSTEAQKSLTKVLKKKGKITANDVRELKIARVQEIVHSEIPEDFFNSPEIVTKMFTVEQLRWVRSIAQSNGEVMSVDAINRLLGE